MSDVRIITVGEDEAEMRLDRWFKVHFSDIRHGELEKLLRTGQVRVAGGRVKANRRLEAGEVIRIPPLRAKAPMKNPLPKVSRAPSEEDLQLIRANTLFEDAAILVLNKPFGLAVQGGTKTARHLDAMLEALEKDGERPRLVHRLDRDTGGLLLLAKTRTAAVRLGAAFRDHNVEKTYWSLTAGVPRPREGVIDMPIAKRMVHERSGVQERIVPAQGDDAKPAITHFQTIDEAGPSVAFLALRPVTGRTHQLRVHCAAMGTPVVGDGKYGGQPAHIDGVSGKLHLFCRSMTFPHPTTRVSMTLTAPLTGHMKDSWTFFGFDKDALVDWPEFD